MGKQEKLLERFLSEPKDFTWGELCTLLGYYDYNCLKGNGSRRKFFNEATGHTISLHQPHPGNIIKAYAIRDTIDALKDNGVIPN